MAPKTALAAALAIPAAVSARALPRDTSDVLIVGGVEASPGDFPFIVSLQQSGSHFCGGTLLNSNTVVTAAHCSTGTQPSSVTVIAGTQQLSSGGTEASVEEIIVHPEFDESTINNDVAIWRLSDAIEEGEGISFATLPDQGSDLSGGDEVTVAGWGALEEGDSSLPDQLMKVTVPVTDRDTCSSQYGGGQITDAMVCAGIEEGGKDACQGDSGGPLVDSSNTLVGIVSWGNGCAQAGYSGVYTRVGQFVQWISQQI